MVDLGDFVNEYAVKLHVFLPLVVGAALGLPIFGHFYNQLMDRLSGANEHLSMYVAGGNLVTLAVAALFSWKAALLVLALFVLDGLPMINGEFKRTEKAKKKADAKPRRQRLPYAANGLLDEAKMAGDEARKVLGRYLKGDKVDLRVVEHELNTVMLKILEVQNIQVK